MTQREAVIQTLERLGGIEWKSELAIETIIVHISNDKLGSIMIPLPPLEEQEEIVKKLEELFKLYEKLTKGK